MMFLSTIVAVALAAQTGDAKPPPREALLLDRAYAAIAAGEDLEARTYLLEAETVAPTDARPRKELFYVDLRLKRFREAFGQADKAQSLGARDDSFRLDVAYALLDAGHDDEGDALMRALASSANAKVAAAASAQLAADSIGSTSTPAQTADGSAADPDLQSAYDADDRGDHQGALAALDAYLKRVPTDDEARLQRDYDLIALGRAPEADKDLVSLESSDDAAVAANARAQLAADTAEGDRGDVFTYVQREGRFGGTFYGSDAIATLGNGRVQPYVALHAANDVAGGGALRQTLTDRVASFDAGVRIPAGSGGWAFAEAGEGFGLAGQGNEPDARYGYEIDRDWGSPDGPRPHTAFDASAAEYSRYAGNAIGYAQLTHDFALVGPVRGVLETDAAVDARRFYFNNTAEIGAGVSIGSPSFSVRLLTVRGLYLPRGIERPVPASYGTARMQLLFGLSL